MAFGKQVLNAPAEQTHRPAMAPGDLDFVCTGWDTGQGSSRSRQLHDFDIEARGQLHAAASCGSDTGSEDKGLTVGVGCRKDSHAPVEDQTPLDWGSRMDEHLMDVCRSYQIGFHKLQADGSRSWEMHGQSLETGGHLRSHKLEKREPERVASGGAD